MKRHNESGMSPTYKCFPPPSSSSLEENQKAVERNAKKCDYNNKKKRSTMTVVLGLF